MCMLLIVFMLWCGMGFVLIGCGGLILRNNILLRRRSLQKEPRYEASRAEARRSLSVVSGGQFQALPLPQLTKEYREHNVLPPSNDRET